MLVVAEAEGASVATWKGRELMPPPPRLLLSKEEQNLYGYGSLDSSYLQA